MIASARSRSSAWLPVTILLLLCVNVAYFALAGSTSEAIDSVAWLTLLVLFLAETRWAVRLAPPRVVVRTLRVIAGMGVIAASIGYAGGDDVLDAVNSVLWIAVVILLEFAVRFPRLVAPVRALHTAAVSSLFVGLALLVALWVRGGAWLDAYDAALWIAAFAVFELELATRGAATIEAAPAPR